MGFIFSPGRKAGGAGAPAGHHERDQARPGTRRALRHGAGRLRLRHQRARHPGGAARAATTRSCPPATTRSPCPPLLRTGSPRPLARAPRRTGPLHRRLPQRRQNSPAWCDSLFDHLLPRAQGQEEDRAAIPRSPARSSRLRPRPARADPGRPARRPHRPGAEPPARSTSRIEDAAGPTRSTPRHRDAGLRKRCAAAAWSPWSPWPAASAAAGPRARAWSRR